MTVSSILNLLKKLRERHGGKMNKEQKRYIWLIIGMSFWAGFGLSSIINIIKNVYTHQALRYDWIMFAVSIIFVIICLIYLTKIKRGKID
jgi:ABC-type multidrug transport system permease subunit